MTVKNNPLFIDSTKFHGDSIGTQVELRNVAVYEGEDLYIVVTNHQGISLRVAMTSIDERTFEARVHLNHQKSITYYFLIEKDGREVLRSTLRKGRAQYAILEDWMPDVQGAAAERLNAPPATEDAEGNPSSWTKEASSTVKSLMDKWGF